MPAIITKIEVQKRNKEKVNIYLDGKYSFPMTMNGLLESGIKEGMELTEDEIQKIHSEDEPSMAVLQAVNIISYSMRTEKELRLKLKEKKFSENSIEHAVERMKKYGYINDEAYAASYIQAKAIPNGWGEQKIISMLLSKGIEKQIAAEKIAELYSYEDMESNAMAVARKYYAKLKNGDVRKNKQKLYGHLVSKGFKYDLASSICRKLFEESDNTEDFCE